MASNLLNFDWTQDKPSQYEMDDDFGEFTSAAGPSLPIVTSLNSIIHQDDLPTVDYAGIQPVTTPIANGFFGPRRLLTSTFSKPPTLPAQKSAPSVRPQSFATSSLSSQSALDGLDDFGEFCTSPAFPVVPKPTSVRNATATAVSAVHPPPPLRNDGPSEPPPPTLNLGVAPPKPNYCISLDEEELFTPTIAWMKPEDRETEAPSFYQPGVPAPLNVVESLEEDDFGDFTAAQTSFSCDTSPPSNIPAPTLATVSSTPNYNAIGPKDALDRLRTNAQPSACLSSFENLDQSAVHSALSGFDSFSVNKKDIAFLDDEQGLTVGYFNPLEEEPPSSPSRGDHVPLQTTGNSFGDFVQFSLPAESAGAIQSPDDDFGDFIQPNFESPSLLLPSNTKLDLDSDVGKHEERDESVEEIVEVVQENNVSSPESDSRLSPEGLSAGEDDEFGDFATEFNPPLPELEIPIVKPVLSSLEPEEEEEFGDFADFTAAPVVEAPVLNRVEDPVLAVGAGEFDSASSDDGFDDFAAAPTPSASSSSLPLNFELQSNSIETQLQTLVKTMFPLPNTAVSETDKGALPISSLDLLCQSSRGAIWAYVRDPNSTPALSFQWSKSKLRDTWLTAIGVDEHSLALGFAPGMPRFAASLSTPLQPVKLGSPLTPVSDASASIVDSSGLCNTLDLDFFVTRSPNDEGDPARVAENNLDVIFAKPTSKSPLSVPKFSPNPKVSGLVSQSSLLDDFLSPSQSLSESRNLNNLGPADLLA